METVLSVILGEIAHRSISFLINKFSNEAAAALPPDENLRRVLMRVHIVVEEAEGRQIRNQAMLQQLKILSATMYRGYYVLDTFRYRAYREENGEDYRLGTVSHSFALSKFNPAKRIQLLCGGTSSTSSQGEKELCGVLGSMEITITNASDFIMFLNGCPPLCRRIYSTYLVMERCMFARHVEMEHIINFLMEKGSPGTQDLDVLPIVGPMKAGKSTLVEHACNDERVRMAFSQIVLLTEDDLDERLMTSMRDGGTVKHRSSHALDNQRLLLIVELNGDVDEATWSNLYSSCKRYAANDSKVIICSRSDEIARFGTAPPLRVEYLTQEAYWYFFKALAFGSANPKEEPKLASMAMEIAACISSSFIAANSMARILRTNFSAEFWRMCVSWVKVIRQQRDGRIFGAHPVSPWQNKKPAYSPRISNPNEYFWIFDDYQVVYAHDEVHQLITFQEVLLRDVVPHGNYNVLAWRSSIPPHSCCIFRCGVNNKAPKMSVQKKRTHS